MRALAARFGRWFAGYLFDEYMNDLIETYVRRERDRWADAFEHEKLRNAHLKKEHEMLLNLLVEQKNLEIHPMYISNSPDFRETLEERWRDAHSTCVPSPPFAEDIQR